VSTVTICDAVGFRLGPSMPREAVAILARHAEAGYAAGSARFYHTIASHILPQFEALVENFARWAGDGHGPEAAREQIRALQVAWLFHDVVYNPIAKDNEERSAESAEAALAEAGLRPLAREVRPLILATKEHDPKNPLDSAIVATDLGILSARMDAPSDGSRIMGYRACAAAIYREYLEAGIPAERLASGRKEWIERTLARTTVMPVLPDEPSTEAREKAARENLRFELAAIRRDGLSWVYSDLSGASRGEGR
jgi:predicted metal-dependent HD superfamily phosphohydrolase